MLYLQIASPKSSVLNFLDSNSFEVIISIFQRTEKVPDMERLLFDAYGLLRAMHSRFYAPLRSVLNMCHWHIAPYPLFAYRGIISIYDQKLFDYMGLICFLFQTSFMY